MAAFTVDVLVYPLDTIKTRYQSQQYLKKPAAAKKALSGNPFRGLYQGIGSVVIATLPAAGVFFLTYETAKSAFTFALSSALPQPAIHAVASGCAELASCVVLTPAEVIKQNAQVLSESASGRERSCRRHASTSLRALHMVWESDGRVTRRMWAGYSALVARNLPFTALHFPMFEFFRKHLWDERYRRTRGPEEKARCGPGLTSEGRQQQAGPRSLTANLVEVGTVTGAAAAASGAIASFVTAPMDVVKTRTMLLGGQAAGDENGRDRPAKAQRSGLQLAKVIFQEAGIRGLFRGALFRIGWTAVGSGLYLGSYEMAKSWLKGGSPPAGGAGGIST